MLKSSMGEKVTDVYVAVHPGYAFQNDEYKELNLGTEDYFRYNNEFFNEFDRALESDAEVAVFTEESKRYSKNYLGELSEEVDRWFDTVEGEARLTYDDAEDLIDFVWSMEDVESVTVSGELHNLCQGQTMQIIDYVAKKGNLNPEIRKGTVFPKRPLQRDEEENLEFVSDSK